MSMDMCVAREDFIKPLTTCESVHWWGPLGPSYAVRYPSPFSTWVFSFSRCLWQGSWHGDEIFEEWLTSPASLLRRCYRCLNVMTSLPPWIHATVSLRSLRLPLVWQSKLKRSSLAHSRLSGKLLILALFCMVDLINILPTSSFILTCSFWVLEIPLKSAYYYWQSQ
jgi:hypothetical protein